MSDLYSTVLASLNKQTPFLGFDQLALDKVHDDPMAAGLILAATSKFKDESSRKVGKKCLDWLLANADQNKNGICGYGLPMAWDAFSDGNQNPAHAEYTITSGLVIMGLLDYRSQAKSRLLIRKIDRLVVKIFKPYIDSQKYFSPAGIPGYSLRKNDLAYDVVNPAAFLAGQAQRFSCCVKDKKSRAKLRNLADQTMEQVYRLRKQKKNSWFWQYQLDKEKPNDLAHAIYTVLGIVNYQHYQGKLAHLFNWRKVCNHITEDFCGQGRWWRFPKFCYQKRDFNKPFTYPRLWSLGSGLFFFSRFFNPLRIFSLLNFLRFYELSGGRYALRVDNQHFLIRHQAHLLWGLAEMMAREKSHLVYQLWGAKNWVFKPQKRP